MDNSELFKWLAIASPIFSGVIVGIVSHTLSNRSKRIELLYQHKIPAFQEIYKILTDYKFELESNVYDSEFLESNPDSKGSLETVSLLNNAYIRNSIYLNKKSRQAIMDLVGKIHFMCSFQLTALQENFKIQKPPYVEMTIEVNKVIEILYKDLNIK
ncbi:hypothetical protein [Flavobacterium microcysteis]|uniref:DUF4760 domain-containing protein n=1 Tax=Flavobacterium microcysteis TaxID=2596891 RepID=A0A501QG06_9FLAO|nr:hypothetical protein [Flavobacterium microcysteis]TPD71091.1 hypothetical protein FJA49_04110 [Flavobacterium microcysteis]